MAFKPGHQLSKGRPAGSLNRRSIEFRAVLEAAGFCPATAMMDTYKTALTKFAEECAKEDNGRISPMESHAAKYLKIASDNAADLASYTYPKLKAIEQKKSDPLSDMTPEQKLEALKEAVKVLQAQVKANGSGAS